MAVETAKRDPNYRTTIQGVDLSTGLEPTNIYVDEVTHRMLVSAIATNADGTDINAVGSLVPKVYDTVQITSYNGNDDPLVILYKTGGTGGTTVATLTLTYSGTNITSVVRT